MTYRVALTAYEGPLDLLLQLVEKQKLPITAVSLSEVTGQYLEYLKDNSNLSPDQLNNFIELAARLLHVKSLALLPSLTEEDTEAARGLEETLERYVEYKELSRLLQQKLKTSTELLPRPSALKVDDFDKNPNNVSLDSLNEIYTQLLKRLPTADDHTVIELLPSLPELCDQLRQRLKMSRRTSLIELLGKARNRLELVLTFTALLELTKEGSASLEQESQFDDILVVSNV